MKAKKVLLLVLCAVLLVVGSVMGTLAYLQDTDSVANTFTVGNVDITMDETDIDNDANTADNVTYGEDANAVVRDKANTYRGDNKLVPGKTVTKDPIIHVASSSENCYLFLKVENGLAGIEVAEDDATVAPESIGEQLVANGWAVIDATNGIWVYGTATAPTSVAADTDVNTFTSINIKEEVENTELGTYENKTVKVTAYAIQAEGFSGKTASEIWTAGWGS